MMRVVELFAGVGGFRIGFEGPPENPDRSRFGVIWSNQWEPSTKAQHAAEVYVQQWNLEQSDYDLEVYSNGSDDKFVNKDIGAIEASDIPDHDLLCGGFPCQDYSVARTSAKGLEGKKGVLWWEIFRILKEKRPGIVMLENVDRLLKSPTSQRGRDFAVMLASLSELDYVVEWRVINAADYGMPQRRKRVFIIGYLKSTSISDRLNKVEDIKEWLTNTGLIASSFGVESETGPINKFSVKSSPENISKTFGLGQKISQFKNTGLLKDGKVFSLRTKPILLENKTLRSIKYRGKKIDNEYFIDPLKKLSKIIKKPQINGETIIIKTELDMWNYLKGAKKEWRSTIDRNDSSKSHKYKYAEGKMTFPDNIDKPSRTIITGEGGRSASRFKHVIKVGKKFRRLLPIELERLNMFPDDHTKHPEVTDAKRAFFMGNALVVGVVEVLGKNLAGMHFEL